MLWNSTKSKNSIARRCEKDTDTQLRLQYNPWYLSLEAQRGACVVRNGREMTMFSSNDYLGLSDHPAVIEATHKATLEWGTSTTGARFANGSRNYHARLEAKLAAFLGKEACHVFSAGYLACMSGVNAFAQRGDLILADWNIHSSLWSGILLTRCDYDRFGHNNPAHLLELLNAEKVDRPKMIVLEGVYSMEGHLACLPDILKAAEPHNCFVVLDDAHGLGVMGPDGRGTVAHFAATDRVDVICGSLSKSLASTGGFIAGSSAVVEYMRSHSKTAIFSAAISPGQAAAAEAALDILQSDPMPLQRLWENAHFYHQLLSEAKIPFWESQTPAVPILIGERVAAYKIWMGLMDAGFFTVPAIPPGVPPGKELIRTAVSARHTREQISAFVTSLKKLLKKHT
jgi:8-amino-7-oxononanoate synthase